MDLLTSGHIKAFHQRFLGSEIFWGIFNIDGCLYLLIRSDTRIHAWYYTRYISSYDRNRIQKCVNELQRKGDFYQALTLNRTYFRTIKLQQLNYSEFQVDLSRSCVQTWLFNETQLVVYRGPRFGVRNGQGPILSEFRQPSSKQVHYFFQQNKAIIDDSHTFFYH